MDEESNRNRPFPVPSWTYYEPIMKSIIYGVHNLWTHCGSIVDPLWTDCEPIRDPLWIHLGPIVTNYGPIVDQFWVHC